MDIGHHVLWKRDVRQSPSNRRASFGRAVRYGRKAEGQQATSGVLDNPPEGLLLPAPITG